MKGGVGGGGEGWRRVSREIERERERDGGRKGREGGKCGPSVQQPCHKPTITQASGPQFNIKTCFAPVCEGEVWVQLKKQKWVIKLVHLLLFYMSPLKHHLNNRKDCFDAECRELLTSRASSDTIK